MNIFDAVTQSVTAKMAAESCGLKINRAGKAVCPFHNDRHPSLKLDERFHCFACGADGNAINFIERYYGMTPYDATKYLADTFGVIYDEDVPEEKCKKNNKPAPAFSTAQKFEEMERYCYRTLCDYLRLLEQWKEEYAPKDPDEEWHPLFQEALQRKAYVEYLLDEVFLNGSIEDRAQFIQDKGKEVTKLERRIRELTAGQTGSVDPDHERDGGNEISATGEDSAGTAKVRPEQGSSHGIDGRSL